MIKRLSLFALWLGLTGFGLAGALQAADLKPVETITPAKLSLPFSQQYLPGPKGKRLFS